MSIQTAVRTCRECGCTDATPCDDEGQPCHWVAPDLCSACAEEAPAPYAVVNTMGSSADPRHLAEALNELAAHGYHVITHVGPHLVLEHVTWTAAVHMEKELQLAYALSKASSRITVPEGG